MTLAERRSRSAELKAARALRQRVEAVCLAVRLEQGQARSSRPLAPRARATRERVLRWRVQRPEGPRAHKLVYAALREGRLSRPERCEACGGGGRFHAHHADYRRPLDVRWLCCSCHRAEHRRLREETRRYQPPYPAQAAQAAIDAGEAAISDPAQDPAVPDRESGSEPRQSRFVPHVPDGDRANEPAALPDPHAGRS